MSFNNEIFDRHEVTLRNRLKAFRAQNPGYTQEYVARQTDLSQMTISNFLTKPYMNFRPETIARIENFLRTVTGKPEDLYEKLEYVINSCGVTKAHIARLAGITTPTLANFLNTRGSCTHKTYTKLSDAVWALEEEGVFPEVPTAPLSVMHMDGIEPEPDVDPTTSVSTNAHDKNVFIYVRHFYHTVGNRYGLAGTMAIVVDKAAKLLAVGISRVNTEFDFANATKKYGYHSAVDRAINRLNDFKKYKNDPYRYDLGENEVSPETMWGCHTTGDFGVDLRGSYAFDLNNNGDIQYLAWEFPSFLGMVQWGEYGKIVDVRRKALADEDLVKFYAKATRNYSAAPRGYLVNWI